MEVKIVEAASKTRRVSRRPSHPFNIKAKPWQIVPMHIAPVMPGETMKNLLLQARIVSDPIKHPLIGWWSEHFFFYVKLRDLADRDMFTDMIMSPDLNNRTSAIIADDTATGANAKHFHAGFGTNFVGKCLDTVTKWYFRDEDENTNDFLIDGLPAAKVNNDGWWQSMVLASLTADTNEKLPGEEETDDSDGAIAGMANQYAHWQAMRSMSLTAATFEDYLKSYGVSVPAEIKEEIHKPELIRYFRDWTYPSNTVDPITGAPSSAVSWSIADRADKDRYFKEPGFIFGVQCIRPKIYMEGVQGSLSSYLSKGKFWMPKALEHLGYTTVEEIPAGSGILGAVTSDVWVDVKDLFLHGEAFVNHADFKNGVTLPSGAAQIKYTNLAAADGLFKDAAKVFVKTDGVVSLDVASDLRETTK